MWAPATNNKFYCSITYDAANDESSSNNDDSCTKLLYVVTPEKTNSLSREQNNTRMTQSVRLPQGKDSDDGKQLKTFGLNIQFLTIFQPCIQNIFLLSEHYGLLFEFFKCLTSFFILFVCLLLFFWMFANNCILFPINLSTALHLTTVFVDTRLWKTKHLRKRFQNFRQSYVLLTDRIEIHQSKPIA